MSESEHNNDIKRFGDLDYDDFKKMAEDPSLSSNQKIGFPDSYRKNTEGIILKDIISKNPSLQKEHAKVLDIGAGCSDLIKLFIKYCGLKKHQLTLIDSKEMLSNLPDDKSFTKIPGYYPAEFHAFIEKHENHFDCIITYSVFHYIFEAGDFYDFIDRSLDMLKPNGTMLIGDIPNVSKRHRFFSSERGVKFHREYTGTETNPPIDDYKVLPGKIDDGVLFGILQRYRNFGFETYILSQPDELPMANRREDILIKKN